MLIKKSRSSLRSTLLLYAYLHVWMQGGRWNKTNGDVNLIIGVGVKLSILVEISYYIGKVDRYHVRIINKRG